MAELEGKTAIVTGASSGIGAAIARALAGSGAKVAGGSRHPDGLETEIALELDVTDPASCQRFVEQAVEKLGGLDILVNNAGLGLGRDPFDESSEEDEETVLETNVQGVLRMTRLCLPHIRDGGHIVNIGSVAGREPYENAAVYVTSKFAVRGFTESLALELAAAGAPVKATVVHPGGVKTNIARAALARAERLGRPVTEEDRARERFYSETLLRMPPSKAARIIVDGVEADRPRVLVGTDARVLDVLVRAFPARWPAIARPAFRRLDPGHARRAIRDR